MKRSSPILTAAALLAMASSAYAVPNVVTVDGVGGAAVTDPGGEFNTSYATLGAAMTAVNADATLEGVTINITVARVDEPAGILVNSNQDVTINGLAGGTHLAIAPSGIGLGAAPCGMVLVNHDTRTLTLRDLVITPGNGAAGGVSARAIQSYNAAAGAITTTTLERVMVTAIRPTGHPNQNDPVLNPLVHAASANTKAARYAELRSFSGGGANNLVELRNNAAPTAGAVMTYNLNDFVVTHGLVDGAGIPAAAAKGGGIAISRTAEIDVNVGPGSVFSFNDGSGIRGVATLAATSFIDIDGTTAKPVIFLENGWMEDAASTARNEGIQNDGTTMTIDNAYFVGNYQEGIDKLTRNLTVTNTFFANNQKDLDTGAGTAPNGATAANVKVSSAATYSFENVTIFDNLGGSNANGINFAGTAGAILNLTNTIIAGAGDGNVIGGAAASTVNETNVAIVTAGTHAVAGYTVGAGVTRNQSFAASADPQFASTTFAPVWNGLGNDITGLGDYLRVTNFAGYSSDREVGSTTITGANPTAPTPPPVSTVIVDGLGGGDFTTIQDAISSFTSTGANAAATPPFTINIDPAGGPYNERITLNSAYVGLGDIVGDLTIQSLVPGTHAVLALQRDAGEAANANSSCIQLHQSEFDVTLRDLLIHPALPGIGVEDAQRHIIKIDENSPNATLNTITLENVIVTEVATDGDPLITSRAEAYLPPRTASASGRNATFSNTIQYWGDNGESLQVILDNVVAFGPPAGGTQAGNHFRGNMVGSNGESITIIDSVFAYGPTAGALVRIGTGNTYTGSVTISGTDASAGPDSANVFLNSSSTHALTFEGTLNASASGNIPVSIDNAIFNYVGGAPATQRAISQGTGIWNVDTISDLLINTPGAAIVGSANNAATYSNITAVSNQAYFGLGGAGSITVRDSIFTGVDSVAADGKFGGTAPTGGMDIDFVGFGSDVVNQVGTTVTGTFTVGSNVVVADPLFLSTTFTDATYLDVDSQCFAGAGTASSNLAGGANYVGGTACATSINNWMILNDQ